MRWLMIAVGVMTLLMAGCGRSSPLPTTSNAHIVIEEAYQEPNPYLPDKYILTIVTRNLGPAMAQRITGSVRFYDASMNEVKVPGVHRPPAPRYRDDEHPGYFFRDQTFKETYLIPAGIHYVRVYMIWENSLGDVASNEETVELPYKRGS